VSAILSGATLAIGLYALVRVHLVAAASLGPELSSGLLVAFGLFSIAVALPFLIAQGDLKRLLAYSSIEHLGVLALAVGFGGRLALLGATLHLVGHALAKATAFVAAGDLVQGLGSRRLGRLRDAVNERPAAGWPLLIAILLLGGLPPSATFTAEVAILIGGFEQGWGVAVALAAVLLGCAFAAVAFHALRVAWGHPRGRRAGGWQQQDRRPIGRTRALLLAAPLAVVAVFGLWLPEPVATAIDAVVGVLSTGRPPT
jgi:hydrogenase-4 component F